MKLYVPKTRQRRTLKLNMAPMIDCVFLLLIFFMVSTTFVPMRGIRVKLPPPMHHAPDQTPKGMIIKIQDPIGDNSTGTMLLDGTVVLFDELFTLLLNATDEQRARLIIMAQRDVYHEQIIRVMDTAKDAGIDSIDFARVAHE